MKEIFEAFKTKHPRLGFDFNIFLYAIAIKIS